MNDLFEKSYEELRESFVRNRFAEEQHFGREDVEEWLQEERLILSPHITGDTTPFSWEDLIPRFGSIGVRLEESMTHSQLLHQFGAKWENCVDRLNGRDQETLEHLSWLIKKMDGCVWGLCLWGKGAIFWNDPNTAIVLNARIDTSCSSGVWSVEVDDMKVASSLLLSWKYEGKEWQRARQLLCDWGERCVVKVRKGAEKDFDQAVAVSADGKRIVCADEVWVYRDTAEKGFHRVPVELFTSKKILLGGMSECNRIYCDLDEGAFGKVLQDASVRSNKMALWGIGSRYSSSQVLLRVRRQRGDRLSEVKVFIASVSETHLCYDDVLSVELGTS